MLCHVQQCKKIKLKLAYRNKVAIVIEYIVLKLSGLDLVKSIILESLSVAKNCLCVICMFCYYYCRLIVLCPGLLGEPVPKETITHSLS